MKLKIEVIYLLNIFMVLSVGVPLVVPIFPFLISGLLLSNAYADDFHYRSVLIGERGASLGGAYIAISDDPSGVFYNPAGIVFGFENYISGSANTYTSSQTVYKQVAPGQDYTYNSQSFSPSFIGFSQSVGKQKFAFAIIVPSYDLLDQDDLLSSISTKVDRANTLLRRYYNQNITYSGGPAYSVALGERLSFGVSLLVYVKTNVVINTQLIEDNPLPNGKYFIQESYLKENYYGLTPKLGFQFMPSPKLSLGFTAKKNYNLSGGTTIRTLSNKLDASGVPAPKTGGFTDDFTTNVYDLKTGVISPWELGLGSAYFFSKSLLVAADIIYYTADSAYNQSSVVPTLNWSLGAEWYMTDALALRFGLFSNAANTPAVDSTLTNQSTHVDLYGGSFGISILKSGSSFTLGTSYSSGIGKGQAFANSTTIQEVSQSQLSVYLAGSYQL
ncbi:MAG: hypothetical protein ABIQ95_16150 [Bdellovibrionia bacterium]